MPGTPGIPGPDGWPGLFGVKGGKGIRGDDCGVCAPGKKKFILVKNYSFA